MARELKVRGDELDRLLNLEDQIPIVPHIVPSWLSHYESLVEGAGFLREVELAVVPGLLQTEAYALAVERLTTGFTNDQRATIVKTRMARQEALYRTFATPLHLEVLVAEGILWDNVATSDVMATQMRYLAMASAEHPNIDVRVIPQNGMATLAVSGFELLTRVETTHPFLAVTFDVAGAKYYDNQEIVDSFLERYRQLRESCFSTEDSIEHLNVMAEFHQLRDNDFESFAGGATHLKLWRRYGYRRNKG